MRFINILAILFVMFTPGCKSNIPPAIEAIIEKAGNKNELLKVIDHYQSPGDSLKLLAAYFLIKNMDDQYHYRGQTHVAYLPVFRYIDSMTNLIGSPRNAWESIPTSDLPFVQPELDTLVKDIDVVTADFLISNIDDAFTAWHYPWARHLTFKQFCKYILPYKLKNEPITNWRHMMMEKYKWVKDSLQDSKDVRKVVGLINKDMQKWFGISARFTYPYDLSFNDLMTIKVGRCDEATQLAAYAMRAMGVPVTLDFALHWANKKGGHAWNCLLTENKPVVFMGTESNPGYEKIAFSGYGPRGDLAMERKRAKIFRYSYLKQNNAINADPTDHSIPSTFLSKHLEDVTATFIPVSDIPVPCKEPAILSGCSFGYLCVFNDREWKPIAWSAIHNNSLLFKNMGRDIVYLPVVFKENTMVALSNPLQLTKEGNLKELIADETSLDTIRITRKYPEDWGNQIFAGKNYEVYYWKGEWVSMGQQLARNNYLVYGNAPRNGLFYVRNLDEGFQERIFTIENGKQIWW